jgi:gas vesicle protein
MNGTGKFIGGLLIGATAGVITGLLIAPTSGTQIRQNLMKRSRVYSQQAIDAVRQYLENIKQGKIKGDTILSNQETEEMLNRLKARPNG